MEVSEFHKQAVLETGFELTDSIEVAVNGNGFGRNGKVRINHENIYVFKKI